MSLDATSLLFDNDTETNCILNAVTTLREKHARTIATYSAYVNELQVQIRQLEEQMAGTTRLLAELSRVMLDNEALRSRVQELGELVWAVRRGDFGGRYIG